MTPDASFRAEWQDPPVIAAPAFDRAVALLEVIRHDLEATVRGETALAELERTSQRLKHVECEHARLRAEIHRHLAEFPAGQARSIPGSHAQQLVQAMLDYVHQHSHRPICLKDVATALQMNPDYLAHVFASTVGVRFHHYVGELRMVQAEALLDNPLKSIADVACEVGFTSSDHFRHAFKARLGVAPSAWRSGV